MKSLLLSAQHISRGGGIFISYSKSATQLPRTPCWNLTMLNYSYLAIGSSRTGLYFFLSLFSWSQQWLDFIAPFPSQLASYPAITQVWSQRSSFPSMPFRVWKRKKEFFFFFSFFFSPVSEERLDVREIQSPAFHINLLLLQRGWVLDINSVKERERARGTSTARKGEKYKHKTEQTQNLKGRSSSKQDKVGKCYQKNINPLLWTRQDGYSIKKLCLSSSKLPATN